MKKTVLFSILALALALMQCKQDDTARKNLNGKWKLSAWMESGRPLQITPDQVQFEFMDNGSYTCLIQDHKEAGKFRLDGKKLYTTDTLNANKIEKMVMLSNLATDTIAIEMNRQGTSEQMLLFRSK